MIRKTIIVVLTLAAVVTGVEVLAGLTIGHPPRIHVPIKLSAKRHVCLEAVDGGLYVHYVYSRHENFLDTVDEHEKRYPRWTGVVPGSYGEQDPAYAPAADGPPDPNPNPASIPMVTYAWSYRVGLPIWLASILLAIYPGLVLAAGRSHRGILGFDARIKSTKARMIVATLVGAISMPFATLPFNFSGFFSWLLETQSLYFLPALVIVSVVSGIPSIFAATWLFWRLTPGDHGGPLWRRGRRLLRERGLCEKCAYDLTGNESGVCPECGKPCVMDNQSEPHP